MINIQFIVDGDDVYIIEVNPRSSRTVPYISKVTGIPIVPLATQIICGHTIKELGYNPGLQPAADYIAVKMLNQRGKENTDQKTDHTVLRKYLQNASHLGSGNLLQSFTHQLHSI